MKLKMSQVLCDADPDLQIQGSYLKGWRDSDKKAEGYCAIGLLACKSDSVGSNGYVGNERVFISKKYKITKEQLNDQYKCPECDGGGGIIGQIIHLNDSHKYTYKQIANFLKANKL